MVSSTPGWPSAARIRRITVAVGSALQSIARSGWRISGRGRPVTRGSPGRRSARLAARRSPSPASTDGRRPRRAGPRGGRGCSCPRRGCGMSRVAQTSPPSTSPLASSTVTPHSALAELDRPVERGRAAVAPRAGVHDQAAVPRQIVSGMNVLSIGHTISSGSWRRPPPPSRRPSPRPRPRRRDRARSARPCPLAEAVVGRDQEQDPQWPGGEGRRHRAGFSGRLGAWGGLSAFMGVPGERGAAPTSAAARHPRGSPRAGTPRSWRSALITGKGSCRPEQTPSSDRERDEPRRAVAVREADSGTAPRCVGVTRPSRRA